MPQKARMQVQTGRYGLSAAKQFPDRRQQFRGAKGFAHDPVRHQPGQLHILIVHRAADGDGLDGRMKLLAEFEKLQAGHTRHAMVCDEHLRLGRGQFKGQPGIIRIVENANLKPFHAQKIAEHIGDHRLIINDEYQWLLLAVSSRKSSNVTHGSTKWGTTTWTWSKPMRAIFVNSHFR